MSRLAKRKTSYKENDASEHEADSHEEEKTIPFLRRLTDMLQENEDVISFYPGSKKNGQTVLGRIVVHDRAKVESEVLPRYFNHASFASLRRQLNYFSFTRIGKGRQRGATYCNEAVVELHDILRLKRRAVGTTVAPATEESTAVVISSVSDQEHPTDQSSSSNKETTTTSSSSSSSSSVTATTTTAVRPAKYVNSVVPVVHLPPTKRRRIMELPLSRTKARKNGRSLPIVSRVSPIQTSDDDEEEDHEDNVKNKKRKATGRRITLDLTVPYDPAEHRYDVVQNHFNSRLDRKDEDILAGCNALLSFSNQRAAVGSE